MNFKLNKLNTDKLNWDKLNWDEISFLNFTDNKVILFNKYKELLQESKEKIDKIQNNIKWDNAKKITNPYELIHIKNKNYNNSISKYKPVSRSFFKLIEISNKFNIIINKNINIGCLAEAPGGFIESLYYKYNNNINIYGISIYPNKYTVPNWKKLHKKNNTNNTNNIKLDYGNLYNLDVINKYILYFNNKKAELVTADGGFDFSKNFNNQELDSHHIIFNEIIISILILKKGGNFICKIFDIFNLMTVQIIYLLNELFQEVNIYKPNTSRVANSEKYLVCIGFNGLTNNIKKNCFRLLYEIKKCIKINNNIILNINIPNNFIHLIDIYNKKFTNNQILFLNNTLDIINNKYNKNNIYNLKKKQIKNAIKWCSENKIPINKYSSYLRQFDNLN